MGLCQPRFKTSHHERKKKHLKKTLSGNDTLNHLEFTTTILIMKQFKKVFLFELSQRSDRFFGFVENLAKFELSRYQSVDFTFKTFRL